jgi:hypothetical protein
MRETYILADATVAAPSSLVGTNGTSVDGGSPVLDVDFSPEYRVRDSPVQVVVCVNSSHVGLGGVLEQPTE